MTALRIGDEPLTPAAVVAAARGGPMDVELTDEARERIARSRVVAETVAARQAVYGRTTGVGANRHVAVREADLRAHSVRLLRSHSGGVGDALPDEVVRATLLIRLAQIAAGGGGHRPEIADALAAILRAGPLPVLRDLGGIGTGDLTLLAQLGLALAGEGEWTAPPPGADAPPGDDAGGAAASVEIEPGDALALMSSNAATHAAAALAWADARELLDAGLGIAALAFHALDGNREAFAEQIAAARPLPGLAAVSERLRMLTADAPRPARIQDPFGLRCLPPVAGALHDALAALHEILAVEINAAAENPLVAGDEVFHNGGFHAASAALALDTARLALVPFADLALARLSALMEPELTGLAPFLSAGVPGSSGLMIAEYVGADALARLRALAVPTTTGGISISRGLEEHASFAWQGAQQARAAVGHLRTLLALELVAATRALEGAPGDDAEIAADVARAEAELPRLAEAARRAI